MKLSHLMSIGIIAAGISFTSCKKEGCTDTIAVNYDESVDRDDNSCTYNSQILFWYDSDLGSVPYSASDVTFYMNGVALGSSTGELSRDEVPTCDSTNVVKFDFDMQKSKATFYEYQIRATNGTVLKSKTVNITAGKCNAYDITQ